MARIIDITTLPSESRKPRLALLFKRVLGVLLLAGPFVYIVGTEAGWTTLLVMTGLIAWGGLVFWLLGSE